MKKVSSLDSRTKLIRPLLEEKKETLAVIAKKYFGKIFKDPSNNDQKYLRTKIRDLIKQFEKSGIKHEKIISSINNLGITRDTLNSYLSRVEKKCVTRKKKILMINLETLLIENNEIQLKVLSNCIKNVSKNYYPPRAKKIISLLNKIQNDKKVKSTLGGCIIQKTHNNLAIYKEPLKKSSYI